MIFVDNGTYHQVGGSSSNNYGPKPWNGDPSLLKGKWLTAFNDHVLVVLLYYYTHNAQNWFQKVGSANKNNATII